MMLMVFIGVTLFALALLIFFFGGRD